MTDEACLCFFSLDFLLLFFYVKHLTPTESTDRSLGMRNKRLPNYVLKKEAKERANTS